MHQQLLSCEVAQCARDACFCGEKSSTIISLTEPTIEKKGKRKEERERERKRNGCCSTALATLESRGKDEILCASR